ncbi:hypothetical protein QO034_10020 [Sedimentitalea sp. JM2-8]|uniref:Membrane-bound lysozyme-inhibitor of c-type lysozyme n=1 Tax=Sedimentitalea xiamensis TaxID=3050037 RepID=A0ABT7FE95_9RHOB|nr:hypothetical protein [Sedimentitalea xiamensis]MDK3073447.1 hypothetical protein [Sedimentitalea xiamensis]
MAAIALTVMGCVGRSGADTSEKLTCEDGRTKTTRLVAAQDRAETWVGTPSGTLRVKFDDWMWLLTECRLLTRV